MSRAHHAEYHYDDVIILAEKEYHWLIRKNQRRFKDIIKYILK